MPPFTRARGTVTLRGPMQIVVGQLLIDPGGKIEVDAKLGPVDVFVSDRIDLAPQSTYYSAGTDPTRVRLFVTGDSTRDRDGDGVAEPPVNLGAQGALWGSVYAPNARVCWPSTLALHGSVAAADLVVEAGSRLHFDVALLDVPAASDGEGVQRVSWRIVDVPVTELTRARVDPLVILELSGVAPPAATAARYAKGVDPLDAVVAPRLVVPRVAR